MRSGTINHLFKLIVFQIYQQFKLFAYFKFSSSCTEAMNFPFKTRLGQNDISILVSKDMSVQEMLDALSLAHQINPYSQIVGFRDPATGLIIPPSVVCQDPDQITKSETYEVMIRQVSSQPFAGGLMGGRASVRPSLSNNQHGDPTNSFNTRMGGQSQVSVQNSATLSPGGGNFDFNSHRAEVPQNGMPQYRPSPGPSVQGQELAREPPRQQLGPGLRNFQNQVHSRQTSSAPAGVERERAQDQFSDQIKGHILQLIDSWQTDALLTDQLKQRILNRAQNEDAAILAAYRLFQTDRDEDCFKARIVHKILGGHLGTAGNNTNLTLSAEERQSSMTTAVWNRSAEYMSRFSRGSSGPSNPAGVGSQPGANSVYNVANPYNMRPSTNATHSRARQAQMAARPTIAVEADDSQVDNMQSHQITSQDRYLPIIINLEQLNLIDDQTANIVKTLILEENVEVFRHINGYIAKAIDEQELGSHLIRLAQQLSGTSQAFGAVQRPMSPIPKNKKQLLKFVEQLARYHFNNKEDLDLLNRLIQEENEFVHGIFDVFDSDKDHDSLIDSLQRLLDKSRESGYLGGQGFPHNQWSRQEAAGQFPGHRYANARGMHQTVQTNHSFGMPPQNLGGQQQNLSNRPETSMWPERNQLTQSTPGGQQQSQLGRDNNMFYPVNQGQRHHSIARVDGSSLRAEQAPLGRRGNMSRVRGGNRRDHSQMVSQSANQPFVPPTSYPVEKIPNYFNSDEDEPDGAFPNMQGGTFQNMSLGQVRVQNNNMRTFQGNQSYKMPNHQNYKRLEAKSFGGGMGRGPDFKGTASFHFDNVNGSGMQFSNSVHQSDDRAYFQDSRFGNSGQRSGLMSNKPYRRNPAPRNNNYMLSSMQQREYSAKQHQEESENDDSRGQMAFLARGSVNARPKGPLEAGGFRTMNNDGHEPLQATPNGIFSPYYEQQNMDYGRQGYGAGILVDYDEYGNELDVPPGPFAGSTPMPPGGAYYQDQRVQQPMHARTTKPPRKPYKNKGSAQKQGSRANQGRRRNPRRKHSTEDDRMQDYDGQYYGRQGPYQIDSDGDDLNARMRGTAVGPGLIGPGSYGREDYQEDMSGQSDFSIDSSQSSDSSNSDSSEASSSSKRMQQRVKRSKQPRGSKQGGKSKSKKERKVSKKKKRANKPPKLMKGDSELYRQSKKVSGQIDYQKIIDREELGRKMRTDNYAILLYLIDNNDQEMRTCFQNHIVLSQGKHGADKSNLLAEVQAKTEETFLFLLHKYLNNQEQTNVLAKRSSKDEAYIDVFRQFIVQNQFSLDTLMKNLQVIAAVNNAPEIKKEKFESIFYKVLLDQTFKKNQDKDMFLRQQFDNENEELFQILSLHVTNPNIEQLKQDMHLFVQKHCGPDVYQNLKDAVNGLQQKGALTIDDRNLIMQLNYSDDQHLLAAWLAYSVLQDEDDLADSFRTLCEAKRNKDLNNSQAATKVPGSTFQLGQQNIMQMMPGNNDNSKRLSIDNGSSDNNGDMGDCDADKVESRASNKRAENQSNQMMYNHGMNQNQNSNQVQLPMHQAPVIPASDNSYQMRNSPQQSLRSANNRNNNGSTDDDPDIDPDTEDEGDYEDIESIMQYQHKILRKYAMLGMIQYSAIPFFHQLVQNRDYKMICIFEVFAQNRNEDDFLENLGILDNIRIAGEEQQMRQFPHQMNANAGEEIDAGAVASGDEEPLQDSQMMANVPGMELMGNMKNQGLVESMAGQRDVSAQNQGARLNSKENAGQMMSPIQPQSNPYGSYKPQQKQQPSLNIGRIAENDRGGHQDNQRQKDNQGGQVSGANELRRRESNSICVPEDQPQAQPIVEDSNMAALMEVKDKLSSQQFEWVNEMLLKGDKKITASISAYKKSKDAKDFANTVKRFYNKAFGNK